MTTNNSSKRIIKSVLTIFLLIYFALIIAEFCCINEEDYKNSIIHFSVLTGTFLTYISVKNNQYVFLKIVSVTNLIHALLFSPVLKFVELATNSEYGGRYYPMGIIPYLFDYTKYNNVLEIINRCENVAAYFFFIVSGSIGLLFARNIEQRINKTAKTPILKRYKTINKFNIAICIILVAGYTISFLLAF